MNIYTKQGDKGKTSLLSGEKVFKSDIRIAAYGTIDELNSFIGLLEASEINISHKEYLIEIQNKLFNIGSQLAQRGESKLNIPKINETDISSVEMIIDEMNNKLEALKVFILPGGSVEIAYCHICRSICRRAEREIVRLSVNEKTDELIIKYINRLSDYFFMLARMVTRESGLQERACKY